MTNNELMTVDVQEAGRRLGIGRCTAYRLAREGRIPAIRLGRQLRVPIVALERMCREAGQSEVRA